MVFTFPFMYVILKYIIAFCIISEAFIIKSWNWFNTLYLWKSVKSSILYVLPFILRKRVSCVLFFISTEGANVREQKLWNIGAENPVSYFVTGLRIILGEKYVKDFRQTWIILRLDNTQKWWYRLLERKTLTFWIIKFQTNKKFDLKKTCFWLRL